jgi:hypothetical protein
MRRCRCDAVRHTQARAAGAHRPCAYRGAHAPARRRCQDRRLRPTANVPPLPARARSHAHAHTVTPITAASIGKCRRPTPLACTLCCQCLRMAAVHPQVPLVVRSSRKGRALRAASGRWICRGPGVQVLMSSLRHAADGRDSEIAHWHLRVGSIHKPAPTPRRPQPGLCATGGYAGTPLKLAPPLGGGGPGGDSESGRATVLPESAPGVSAGSSSRGPARGPAVQGRH